MVDGGLAAALHPAGKPVLLCAEMTVLTIVSQATTISLEQNEGIGEGNSISVGNKKGSFPS